MCIRDSHHTAYHAGEAVGLGDGIDLLGRIQAAAFHQLDVQEMCIRDRQIESPFSLEVIFC